MKKFIIEDDFFQLFSEAKIGVIIALDINNETEVEDKYLNLLEEASAEAFKYFKEDNFSDNEVVKLWRDAFQKFKTKKGARSSIEALLKRVHNGKGVTPINPLVDLYNSISLKYALPCGGEDIDTFENDLRLTKALGHEDFITLGSNESAPPLPGEIIYKDDAGAVCRCWNWRESIRTMLTAKTTNALIVIECLDATRLDDLKQALEELTTLIKSNLGGQVENHILDFNNREITILDK